MDVDCKIFTLLLGRMIVASEEVFIATEGYATAARHSIMLTILALMNAQVSGNLIMSRSSDSSPLILRGVKTFV